LITQFKNKHIPETITLTFKKFPTKSLIMY